jgi:hypothetical protein
MQLSGNAMGFVNEKDRSDRFTGHPVWDGRTDALGFQRRCRQILRQQTDQTLRSLSGVRESLTDERGNLPASAKELRFQGGFAYSQGLCRFASC